MEHRLRRMIFDAQIIPTPITRAAFILNQVKSLLREDIPRWIILDMVDLMEHPIDTACADADKCLYPNTPSLEVME